MSTLHGNTGGLQSIENVENHAKTVNSHSVFTVVKPLLPFDINVRIQRMSDNAEPKLTQTVTGAG